MVLLPCCFPAEFYEADALYSIKGIMQKHGEFDE